MNEVDSITRGMPKIMAKRQPMTAVTQARTQKPQSSFHAPPVDPETKAKMKEPKKNPATSPRRAIITWMCLLTRQPARIPRGIETQIVAIAPGKVVIQPKLSAALQRVVTVKSPTSAAVMYGNHLAPKKAIRGPKITYIMPMNH